jgi:enterochelin esterase-like enzyme
MKKSLLITVIAAVQLAGQGASTAELIRMAQTKPDGQPFQFALNALMPEADRKAGRAAVSYGADALFAVDSASKPALYIDEAPAAAQMKQIHGTQIWFATAKLKTGRSHSFHYVVGGKVFGGKPDVAAFGPDSYAKPGVPQGKLSDQLVFTSKIYDGVQNNYWIYVPAQYDPNTPAALMVWQDGHSYNTRDSSTNRVLDVIDNLIAQKRMPVSIHVFTSPGETTFREGSPTAEYVTKFSASSKRTLKDALRSTQYDTVTDRYARFLRDELLAEVQSKYNIRKDGYSRAISGLSSGGICAFNVGWQQPDQFSRVLTWIGTFASIQWRPGELDGGNIFPFLIRKSPRKNLRVWMQDGSMDLENEHGSWPLQNIQMANSLKMREYDVHFSFGQGEHNSLHGSAELPESLTWLWRDYDPAKTQQSYEIEAAEKAKPLFRVKVANRE